MFASAPIFRLITLSMAGLILSTSLGMLSKRVEAQSSASFTSFDAPNAGTSSYQGTFALAIDASGDVAGAYLDKHDIEHAFLRSASGSITTIDAPNTGTKSSLTFPVGFDTAGDLLGGYEDTNGLFHGFVRSASGTLATFSVSLAGSGKDQGTFPVCINDSGEVAGIYLDAQNIPHGFTRSAAGSINTFDAVNVSGIQKGSSIGTYVSSIDAAGDVAGSYMDGNGIAHGFIRTANGVLTTFDAPKAGTSKNQGTGVFGIDTAGDVGGVYLDANNAVHGFIRVSATGTVTSFDAPGAGTGTHQGTSPSGMDASGDIVGMYSDANDVVRGFFRSASGNISTFSAPGASQATSMAKSRSGNAGVNGKQSVSARPSSSAPRFGAAGAVFARRSGMIRLINQSKSLMSELNGFTGEGFGILSLANSSRNGSGGQYFGTGSLGNLGFNGMNSSGSVTGLFTQGDGVAHGFVHTAAGNTTAFDAPDAGTGGLSGTGGFAMNASGTVVGAYADWNSVIHAYVLTLGQVSTSATLASSTNPSIYGEPVTLTATVVPSSGSVPDGETIWFMNGNTALGSGTLLGGTASLTTTDIVGGAETLTAVYGGDTNYAGSISSAVNQSVTLAKTYTTLTSSTASSLYGQEVTLRAAVTGQLGGTPTGTVTFSSGNMVLGSVVPVGNMANLSTTALATGSNSVVAVYSGDTNFATSTSNTSTQGVSQATPTISWATPASIPSATPLSAAQLNAVATVPGVFTYTPAAGTVLGVGSQSLSVSFKPTDAVDYASATAKTTLTVTSAASTTPAVKVTPSATSITTAQALRVEIVVSGGTGKTTPTGTVVLSSGSYLSDTFSLAGGSDIITIPAGWLAIGADSLLVTYVPDSASSSTYTSSYGTSSAVTVTAASTTAGSTSTTLSMTNAGSAATTVAAGSVVTLTATVKAGSTAVTNGLVNFCDGDGNACTDVHLLGTAQLLSGGTASVKFRPGIGDHSYKAIFAGTTSNKASASALSDLTVAASAVMPSTTAIVQSGSVGNYTLTATVGGLGGAPPTGTISFLDSTYGNAVLGTSALSAGTSGLKWINSQTLATGRYANNVVTGNFNGDGITDFVVLNGDDGTVSVLLGNDDGTFTQASGSPVAVGDQLTAIAVGDFNGDGNVDLAVASDRDSAVTILLGSGSGTFAQAAGSPIAVHGYLSSVQAGDFNGDGIVDLAIADIDDNTVSILLGSGTGTFMPATGSPITVGLGPVAILVSDFNGDGNRDLAVLNEYSNTLSILLGNGNGTFTAAAESPMAVGNAPASIATADFNGDGVADLAVANSGSGTVSILLGSGTGTFTQASGSPMRAGTEPISIAVGDFNGDGVSDLAVSNLYGGTAMVYLGSGTGSFVQSANGLNGLGGRTLLAVADFNGDGLSDLVIANGWPSSAIVELTEEQQATATVSGISVAGIGPHQAVASYTGDSNYKASTSATTSLYTPSPAPTFTPGSGTYGTMSTVTISDATPGAKIYYTTNGSTPGTGSTLYFGPITVTATETIKAMAMATGYSASMATTAVYTILQAVATPTFSLSAGSYNSAQPVTISDTTAGATIYYTTDGSTPTTASNVYRGAITVSASETLKAIAVFAGDTNSAVATAVYTITTIAATPTFSLANGTYTSAQTVTIKDATSNATIYYTTNGTTPTTGSTVYSGPITVSSSETLMAIATATGYSTSTVGSAVYTITTIAATPTFSPAPGTYTTAQSVTISDATTHATIYYTTDGSVPTTSSSVYSGAITVSASETVRAIATASGYSSSAVATAPYVIGNPAPVVGGMSPYFTNAGGAAFSLTITGSGFISGSTVYWGTTALQTGYVSATQLVAQVSAAQIANAGANSVTVQNAAPGGGTSGTWYFQVDTASAGTSTTPSLTTVTATVTAGNAASYTVTIPASVSSLSVSCLNLPLGASCSYSATTNAIIIATSSTTPKGNYQITVVFNETISGTASAGILLPLLLLPLLLLRKKLTTRGVWMASCLGVVVLLGGLLNIGCGGGGAATGTSTSTPTQQVTTSGSVRLTVQ